MSFWPGSGIIKSENNDFSWRKTPALTSHGRVDQNKTTESVPNKTNHAKKKNPKKIAALEKATL